jgi:hypothetical protein
MLWLSGAFTVHLNHVAVFNRTITLVIFFRQSFKYEDMVGGFKCLSNVSGGVWLTYTAQVPSRPQGTQNVGQLQNLI